MKFKDAMEAINWYVHRKSNPTGDISTTEACIEILKGERISDPNAQYNPNFDSFEDELVAMCDVGKLLDKFPPFLAYMLMIWAVDGEKLIALKEARKQNPIFRRKSIAQQYRILNGAIFKIEDMLADGGYIKGRYPKLRKAVKKISGWS
jgi:hypothetical protein